MRTLKILIKALPLCIISGSALNAQTIDYINHSSFENYSTPSSESDSSRFLVQATFGPTAQDIENFDGTYEEWIDDQISLPPTLIKDKYIDAKLSNISLVDSSKQRRNVKLSLWNRIAKEAPDQLRQRMSFALSQMLVVSENHPVLGQEPVISAEYSDILTRNAFGNYRDLLGEISRSPAMGYYLSHLKNRKKELIDPSSATYISPDENFARELMQLFTIGIYERNDDFSLKDSNLSQPGIQVKETYDENIVTNLSRVFTGLNFQCPRDETVSNGSASVTIRGRDCKAGPEDECEGVHCHFTTAGFVSDPRSGDGIYRRILHPNFTRPLVCYPRFHDTGRNDNDQPNDIRPGVGPFNMEPYQDKRIIGHRPELGESALPMKPTGCNALNELPNPTNSQLNLMQQCVDYCDSEIEMALDGLFYHPNVPSMVSRHLIQRFITSNPSPKYISDVSAVFKNNGQGLRGDLAAVIKAVLLHHEARSDRFNKDITFGKLKEPQLILTHLYRLFDVVSSDPNDLFYGIYDFEDHDDQFGQTAYRSDSVFNFFLPDYQNPGDIENMNLYSPEFQVYNDNVLISAKNALHELICNGYGAPRSNGQRSDDCKTRPNGTDFGFTTPDDDSSYIPPAFFDALPNNYFNKINKLNLWLMSGQMSGSYNPPSGMKGVFTGELKDELDQVGDRYTSINLIDLIVSSPEFMIQR